MSLQTAATVISSLIFVNTSPGTLAATSKEINISDITQSAAGILHAWH